MSAWVIRTTALSCGSPQTGHCLRSNLSRIKRLGFKTLSDTYVPGLDQTIRTVRNMRFGTILLGHGKTGTRQDVKGHGDYTQALYNAVLAGSRDTRVSRFLYIIIPNKFRHLGSQSQVEVMRSMRPPACPHTSFLEPNFNLTADIASVTA